MTFAALAARNVLRNKLRTLATIAGVAVAILAFVLIRTVLLSWTSVADAAAQDRIGTRHKVSFVVSLPLRYAEDIRQVPGVKATSFASWFGAKDPNREDSFFASIATEPKTFLEVYDEIVVPPEQKQAWFENRRGALVGSALAKQMGWKVGDKLVLRGTIYPGDWEFEVAGIYTALRKSIDQSTLWFHWDYLNESVPPRMQNQIGWIVSRIDDPGRSAEISRAIDAKFEEREHATLTMSERAMNQSFLGMMSAMLSALDVVSIVILLIMLLILGNTIAMGVRERTHEYGVLRAIGFLPKQIAGFVVVESVLVGAAGGTLGLMLSYPLVEKGIGRFLEENMGGMFPYVKVEPQVAGLALGLAALLGGLAAMIPAWQSSRLNVVDALRRVG